MRKRGFFGSIRSRMVAIHMGVTLFAMLIVSVIVINILSNSMLAERVDKQLGETERISFEIAPKLAEEDIDAVFAFIKAKSEALGGRILVLDNYATVTVDSASYSATLSSVRTAKPYPEIISGRPWFISGSM